MTNVVFLHVSGFNVVLLLRQKLSNVPVYKSPKRQTHI